MAFFEPAAVALHSSRGYESESSKLLMRLTVAAFDVTGLRLAYRGLGRRPWWAEPLTSIPGCSSVPSCLCSSARVPEKGQLTSGPLLGMGTASPAARSHSD